MKSTRNTLLALATAGLFALPQAGHAVDLTGFNTDLGFANDLAGGFNTDFGGAFNSQNGSNNIGGQGGAYNMINGTQSFTGPNPAFFNFVGGLDAGVPGGNFNFLWGRHIRNGGFNGVTILTDSDPTSARGMTPLTATTADTFTGLFDNGFHFRTNSADATEGMFIDSTGRIAVGSTDTSEATFNVVNPLSIIQSTTFDTGFGGTFYGKSANGTQAAPTASTNNDLLASFRGSGHDGSSFRATRASIGFWTAQDWTSTAQGTYINFGTTPVGSTNLTEQMRILSNGNVGIGTTTPTRGKLEIAGTSGLFTAVNPITAYQSNGLVPGGPGSYGNISIFASGSIYGNSFLAFSDERIKRIEGRSNTAQDLNTLMDIAVTDYSYIDVISKGAGKHKKVIAQQVKSVFPQAVSQTTDIVPDIYEQSTVTDGWVELTTDLQAGDRVRLIGDKEQGVHEVLDVRDGAFRTTFNPDGSTVFVYGREVDDFHVVDYEALSMLNVSATQEIHRKVETLEVENAEMRAELTKLSTANEALQAKLDAVYALTEKLARLERALSDDDAAQPVKLSLK